MKTRTDATKRKTPIRASSLTILSVAPLNKAYSSLDGVLLNKTQDTLLLYPAGKTGSYIIPGSLTSIGKWAFFGCAKLTHVTIPGRIARIGQGAFQECSGLITVTIPKSVSSIAEATFWDCSGLFNVIIPNSVTNIDAGAFAGCITLTNVTIPAGVNNIKDYAFDGCSGLKSIFFTGNALPDTYLGDTPNATAYYLPGTSGWGSTFGGLAAVLWNPRIQVGAASFGVRTNGFNIAGTPDIPLVVEASSDLSSGGWLPRQTLTLTNGLVTFSEPAWTNYPARFYRLRSP